MPFVNAAAAPLVVGGAKIEHALYSGKVRSALSEFTFAADAIGAYTIPEFQFLVGQRILELALNPSVTLGAATLAIGISGATGKYRAAATLTTPDAWTVAALNAAMGARLSANEQWIMTVAAAALPASGRLLMRVLYVDNS